MEYRPLRTNVLLGNSRVRARCCPPPPDLAEHLLEFWQYEVADSDPYAPIQIYPSGVAALRFDIGPGRLDASLYGPSLSPRMRGFFYRGVAVFGVAIRATRSYSLLGISASELRDLRIQLEVFWPKPVRELKDALWRARDFGERVALLSDFLRRVLRPDQPDAAFMRAFGALVQHGGVLAVRDARGLAASERTLRRHFARFVGLSPKQMARVIRFQQSLRGLVASSRSEARLEFAQLAQRSGYADQAHMIREFAELTGVPPGKFLSYLPRMHDPQLELWSHLSPLDGPALEPPIRKLG